VRWRPWGRLLLHGTSYPGGQWCWLVGGGMLHHGAPYQYQLYYDDVVHVTCGWRLWYRVPRNLAPLFTFFCPPCSETVVYPTTPFRLDVEHAAEAVAAAEETALPAKTAAPRKSPSSARRLWPPHASWTVRGLLSAAFGKIWRR